jgi:DEAD/DEAH box helicase domain-containing protein
MEQRPAIADTISWLRDRGHYSGQIVHHEVVDGQQATIDDLDILPSVKIALAQRGIPNLYAHQVEAIEAVRGGSNAVVATPTASGKTLTYTIPALERAVDREGKTLYIAPYRALINDQHSTFQDFVTALGFGEDASLAVQTGQTDRPTRQSIKRRQPDILLTTIDQLHLSLVPYAHGRDQWRWLFQQLETVVLDEVHMYRGYFGSHASLVLRRFNRLLDHYGTDPEFVCCSATIGNPVAHAATVTAQSPESFELIDTDQSASGDTHWLLWNPPLKEGEDETTQAIPDPAIGPDGEVQAGHDDQPPGAIAAAMADPETEQTTEPPTEGQDNRGESAGEQFPGDSTQQALPHHDEVVGGERRSQHIESVRLFCDLVTRGYQTLVFTRARQGAEQYANWSDEELRSRGQHDLAETVHAYHASLDSDRRRELETALRDGTARGVWSTNALELGIDIGTLDVVLLDGYPGTSMSTFQRAGRAGRGDDACLVILIGSDDPLDQYIMRDPAQLFEGGAEQATVNPQNDAIAPDHVVCAASDHYLSPADETYFGSELPAIVDELEATDRLQRVDDDRVRWGAVESDVQWETNIRTIDEREITLVDRTRDRRLGTLEYSAALRDAHPDAIYMHQKESYRVVELDLDRDRALLEAVDTVAYTRALREKDVTVVETLADDTVDCGERSVAKSLATVTVANQVTGYLRYSAPNDDSPIEQEFDEPLPPAEVQTTGLFFTIPPAVEETMLAQTDSRDDYLGALHAIEHAMISLFPREVLCDRGDIGGLSTVVHPQTGQGTVFIHDAHPGGAGFSAAAYDRLGSLFAETLELLEGCSCESGCPSCIHSPHCGNANRTLDKGHAIRLLRHLLDRPV